MEIETTNQSSLFLCEVETQLFVFNIGSRLHLKSVKASLVLKKWANPGLFLFIFVLFTFKFK